MGKINLRDLGRNQSLGNEGKIYRIFLYILPSFPKALKILSWEAGFLEFSSEFAINCLTFDKL